MRYVKGPGRLIGLTLNEQSVKKCNAVNVEQAIDIGRQQMQTFVENFPDSFHKTISKQVHMLKSEKKGIHLGHTQAFNTEAI